MSRAFKCDRCGQFVSLKKDDPEYEGPLSMVEGEPAVDVIQIIKSTSSMYHIPENETVMQLCCKCRCELDQWIAAGKENTKDG